MSNRESTKSEINRNTEVVFSRKYITVGELDKKKVKGRKDSGTWRKADKVQPVMLENLMNETVSLSIKQITIPKIAIIIKNRRYKLYHYFPWSVLQKLDTTSLSYRYNIAVFWSQNDNTDIGMLAFSTFLFID